MNRIIISTIIALVATFSFAQTDSSPHLAFKGVPIDGTLDDYTSKMIQQGFIHMSTKDGVAVLQGDFAAYNDCTVGVTSLKQKDLVSKVLVIFPKYDSWETLSGNYFSIKKMLSEKYGTPSHCIETFDSYSQPRDDGSKMNHVRLDQCKYFAVYKTEKGDIHLSISGSINDSYVILGYSDKINCNIMRAEAMDDL